MSKNVKIYQCICIHLLCMYLHLGERESLLGVRYQDAIDD